jgi:hypothetical protein
MSTTVPDAVTGGRRYVLSIPVSPGPWKLELGFFSEQKPIASTSTQIEPAEVELHTTSISPFYWGINAERRPTEELGEAFVIGGWFVPPPSSLKFTPADEITYMCYVLNPKLGENGEPDFRQSLSLFQDGKRISRRTPTSAPLGKVADGLWLYGGGLPLSAFDESGEYLLRVKLEQTGSDVAQEVEIPFTIEIPSNTSDGEES